MNNITHTLNAQKLFNCQKTNDFVGLNVDDGDKRCKDNDDNEIEDERRELKYVGCDAVIIINCFAHGLCAWIDRVEEMKQYVCVLDRYDRFAVV